MERLKALIFPSSTSGLDDILSAFDAPGWQIEVQYNLSHDSIAALKMHISEFDWIICEDSICTLQECCLCFSCDLLQSYSLKKDVSLFNFKKVIPNVSSFDAREFYQHLAQCIYSAHFAPESIPTERQFDYQYYAFTGKLFFQRPKFARSTALTLANLSQDPNRVNLGLWEIFINGIEHGNLGISHHEKRNFVEDNNMDNLVQNRLEQTENQLKQVRVQFSIGHRQAFFDVKDEGRGFDWQNFWEIDHTRLFDKNGRGIALARMVGFDTLEYLGCGNHVKCSAIFTSAISS